MIAHCWHHKSWPAHPCSLPSHPQTKTPQQPIDHDQTDSTDILVQQWRDKTITQSSILTAVWSNDKDHPPLLIRVLASYRAWPSPCKVQPPEVRAHSWHHFLSAPHTLPTSLPADGPSHSGQNNVFQQPSPAVKPARVGTYDMARSMSLFEISGSHHSM